MCGIAGVFQLKPGRPTEAPILNVMTRSLRHRGPDQEGFFLDDQAALGIRRLKIIDLKTGDQPIENEDRTVVVALNGEIFNFRELRQELVARGHHFRSTSDTEVIVHLYEDLGDGFVHRLRGMFGIALWDRSRQRFLLVRDRLGVKPLSYTIKDGHVIFGSEIKAILAHPLVERVIDLEAMDLFFSYGHVPGPWSIFRGIRKLPPGHMMVCEHGEARIIQYWDIPLEGAEPAPASLWADRVFALLDEAVRLRMIADVPLGAFLSGGLDSSTVVGLMARAQGAGIETFSVGFQGPASFNELEHARLVSRAFGTCHHELVVDDVYLSSVLPKLVWHLDEPFGDEAVIPTHLVSAFARNRVTVVLTGEGGDELFGGYRRYSVDRFARQYGWLPRAVTERVAAMADSLPLGDRARRALRTLPLRPTARRYPHWLLVADRNLKEEIYEGDVAVETAGFDPFAMYEPHFARVAHLDPLAQVMYADLKTWLPDTYLVKVDIASMAASLEARTPFLDHVLVEAAARIPSNLKIRGLATKYVLKRAVGRLLPVEIVNRKKHGFAVPTAHWLRGRLGETARQVFAEAEARGTGLLKWRTLEWLLDRHRGGKGNHADVLWLSLVFALWHRILIEGERDLLSAFEAPGPTTGV